ncbi:glyoxalase [Caulobacter henricii]|uniref:glyoxalase n=1 Tax=Caulobacter henricii TaxID=69395 RepID=UPI000A060F8F
MFDHLGFGVNDRAHSPAFYVQALAAGGPDNRAPGLRPHSHPDYHGAFVVDPDGFNLEAVCHTPV